MKITANITGDHGWVTITPGWLARLFGRKVQRGEVMRVANAAPEHLRQQMHLWVWTATGRLVGNAVERAIEAPEVVELPTATTRRSNSEET